MPKAAMHEDGDPVLGEYKVGPPGKMLAMQPEAKPQRVGGTPHA
jgi:hypothetical protein